MATYATQHMLNYTDLSTRDSFRFLFRCGRCGAGSLSELYQFNTEGLQLPPTGNARMLLWTRQHDAAYARAASEARLHFNLCPICGRWVCASCFYVSSGAVTDICLDCNTIFIYRQ